MSEPESQGKPESSTRLDPVSGSVCLFALELSRKAIESFLRSVDKDSDNFVGGIERLQLEEALDECKKALRVQGTQNDQAHTPRANDS